MLQDLVTTEATVMLPVALMLPLISKRSPGFGLLIPTFPVFEIVMAWVALETRNQEGNYFRRPSKPGSYWYSERNLRPDIQTRSRGRFHCCFHSDHRRPNCARPAQVHRH